MVGLHSLQDASYRAFAFMSHCIITIFIIRRKDFCANFCFDAQLKIKFEIVIVLIEFIQPHESILSSADERFPIRMER